MVAQYIAMLKREMKGVNGLQLKRAKIKLFRELTYAGFTVVQAQEISRVICGVLTNNTA